MNIPAQPAATTTAEMPSIGGLPHGIKLQSPETFDGTMDVEVLDSFFFHVERYCTLTGLVDEVKVANFVSMLLTKHAAIWLRG